MAAVRLASSVPVAHTKALHCMIPAFSNTKASVPSPTKIQSLFNPFFLSVSNERSLFSMTVT